MCVLYISDIRYDENRNLKLVRKRNTKRTDVSVRTPEEAARLAQELFHAEKLPVEQSFLIATDGRYAKHAFLVSTGSVNRSMMLSRDIFVRLLLANAVTGILVHNHPSGRPKPSEEDKRCTERILQASRLIGVPIDDHIILGSDTFYSMREGCLDLSWWRDN